MNTKELDFAYKVRNALNENIDNIPASTSDRLAAARKTALARKKAEPALRARVARPALAGDAGGLLDKPLFWLGRMGLAVPIVVVVAGLIGIYQVEQKQRIRETAEIDAAVLADELPLSAYLDHGFSAYLAKRGE